MYQGWRETLAMFLGRFRLSSPPQKIKIIMSIYAKNFIIDEETGEPKIVKHLNKKRVDRNCGKSSGGWNKSGRKARLKKRWKVIDIQEPSRYYVEHPNITSKRKNFWSKLKEKDEELRNIYKQESDKIKIKINENIIQCK
jgi:hypothetical protein